MDSNDMKMNDRTAGLFKEIFNYEPDAVYFAPGRINLIGEHTDYNGGHVFPCALTTGTYFAVGKRSDRVFRFYSANLPEEGIGTCSLSNPAINGKPKKTPAGPPNWAAYPLGVIDTLRRHGYRLASAPEGSTDGKDGEIRKNDPERVPETGHEETRESGQEVQETGLDMLYFGDLPAGAGLSSSASIEVVTAFALRDLYGLDLSDVEMVRLCQESENVYNGVNCGIMDQFAVAFGKADHALFLDTSTLDYEAVPLGLEGIELVITNTNVKHKLADSAYNTRREECAKALADIQKQMTAEGVEAAASLGALTPADFEKWQNAVSDPVCLKRARHAVTENARTIEAAAALKAGDLDRFGELMKEAHLSMKNDYEATCPELDILAEEAWNFDSCLASRMTGGGFGGCTVSLVRKEAVPAFIDRIGQAYKEKTGNEASFYQAQAGSGARSA